MRNFTISTVKSKLGTNKIFALFAFLWIFYSEFIAYWTLPSTWFEPPSCQPPHCKKILLVSDPQIIGREWGRLALVDFFAIWDSDRYLKRTFKSAYNYIKPDFLIFLGDLTDQGHTATDEEFHEYVKRFRNIFELSSSSKDTTVIISPGDNDIGGVDDVLLLENVERFEKMFNQTEESTVTEFIEFCKVNRMKSTFQNSRILNGDLIRVALTHVPLLREQNSFVKEVVKRIRPHMIFSGHLHTSYHYAAYETDVWSHKHMEIFPDNIQPRLYNFHEGLIHEIIVPTCSYRMGVYNMGYGVAFIDAVKKNVQFSILWLPHRFLQLFIHLVFLLPLWLALILRIYKRLRRNYLKRQFGTPEKLSSSSSFP